MLYQNEIDHLNCVSDTQVVNVRCDRALIDPLNIREKPYTASFAKLSFRGTTELVSM